MPSQKPKLMRIVHCFATALLLSLPAMAFTSTISYTGAVVQYTVQSTGIYDIIAYGASGGVIITAGGSGAKIGGDFSLSAGDILQIVVGGQGFTNVNYAGGGGGTFVVGPGNRPLVVAGGGSRRRPDSGGRGTDEHCRRFKQRCRRS